MTYRNPRGGSTAIAAKLLLVLGTCVLLPLLLIGCSSNDECDEGCYFDDFGPFYHTVTIILNVADIQGYALGEVNVWVDGVAQSEQTSWQFTTLGPDYPSEWRGRQANWIKGGFTVATYAADDIETIEVVLTKNGYYPQGTTFEIPDRLPAEVYAWETFVLQAAPGVTSAQELEPKMKPTPGEVIGKGQPMERSSASKYRFVELRLPAGGNDAAG